jgi:ATP-dependent DNA helicase RecQ
VIFHDSSLMEIHAKKPRTLSDFATISGVGQSKLQRYAGIFIDVIHGQVSEPNEDEFEVPPEDIMFYDE